MECPIMLKLVLLKMNIKRMIEEDNRIGNFINGEFLSYAEQNNVDLNYNEFNAKLRAIRF